MIMEEYGGERCELAPLNPGGIWKTGIYVLLQC
jgi:hypothetical protein